MIILKLVILWVLIGILFNVIIEGFPNPKIKITRAQKRIMIFDILMGPIGWIWFTILGIKKINKV